ncbi:DUF4270 family protein [Pontibacter diazotrophicus]|uniref:DUF4270 family protein n=1 Tax=Pontibacter diazotrophicus TaxID=1400979 RepID=A0A3D8L362_9BACT|nr:DUF4270 family protein [Pontibacter diazotrophicus]RDV11796.1 DUF4270 family protein [Pontibacter diazotrophicus]
MKRKLLTAYNRSFTFCLLLSASILLTSCEDANEVGLGLVEDNLSAYFTDTVTVDVSTVWLDSVVTSGTGALLVGQYTDALVGETTADAYFQVGLGEAWSLDDAAVFDSIRLILPYSAYSYGDTAQTFTLEAYRLQENITAQSLPLQVGSEEASSYFYTSSGLYNTSHTKAEAAPLSSYTFKARPTSGDSVLVPLPDEMGREWLRLKQQADLKLTSATNFLDYFRGMRLSASGAVLGFNATGAVLRLYYSVPSEESILHYYHDFPVTTGTTQYNQLSTDFSSSYLNGIARGGAAVASTAAENMAFAQSGTGLMIRLDFPYLTNLLNTVEPALISSAVLEVSPIANTTQYPFPLPATLALYETYQGNKPIYPLYKNYSIEAVQEAFYAEGNEYGTMGRYQFNITEYLINRLSGSNYSETLMLAAPASAFTQTVNRLAVGGPGQITQRVKLKIYYTKTK